MFLSYPNINSNIPNVLWGNQTSRGGMYVVAVKQCLLISEEKLFFWSFPLRQRQQVKKQVFESRLTFEHAFVRKHC